VETAPAPSSQPFLEFTHIYKAFDSNSVLEDVTFKVLRGETLCILGRSGVGKSVCLRIIMGFLQPDAGRVVVAGEDITNASEELLQRIHQIVTMVFQNGALFDSLTVEENVAFPLLARGGVSEEEISRVVDRQLKMVGIEAIRDRLPSDISTGMKRAVAIARALAAQPEGVLYDEPTTMVDPIMARRLGNLINRLKTGLSLTSIVVTHDMKLAERVADRVVFLDQCKVVFEGAVAEMEHSPVPIVREFPELDRIDFRALLRTLGLLQQPGR
jgi:phospholipid/cholesterol/gamma-HCH transport system ATP-binding protein